MRNDEIPRRKPVMRGAMDGGCACWAPVVPARNEAQTWNATASTQSMTPPGVATDSDVTASSAPDAER